MAFDAYLIADFNDEVDALGGSLPMADHPQSFLKRSTEVGGTEIELWMPGSVDALETLILERRLRVHVNPALRSAVDAATFFRGQDEQRRFTKQKATRRIDMAVALAMAVGAATAKDRSPVADVMAMIA